MTHIPHPHNTARPPLSPAVAHVENRRTEDTARYLLSPDDSFARPYLAIPNGNAFVWPVGIEGFSIVSNTQLGMHKYLGDIEIDVDVTHRGELRITMSGTFPGWSAPENMRALQGIYNAVTPERGKILHLPGIYDRLQYVVGENLSFDHPDDDIMTMDIGYSVTFIKIGAGSRTPDIGPEQPDEPASGGIVGKHTFVSNQRYNTLKKIAVRLYRNPDRWRDLFQWNRAWFKKRKIPSHKARDYKLPAGTKVRYNK